jgi:hypothetical protein
MTIKQKRKRKQRAISVKIKIFDYGSANFGEPPKSRLESLKFQTRTMRTYRRDYSQYSFVRCRLNESNVILVIKFEENQVERSSCQLLKKWDPKSLFI